MAKGPLNRRSFLKTAAGAVGAATQANAWTTNPAGESTKPESPADQPTLTAEAPEYPRRFRGRQLTMISFPLGGVAAGSLGLGGRGQLCNWEIFNRPNKGYRPTYAFPSIWVQTSDRPPVARVLESRILPPYEGQDGLGSNNVPGLSRLESAIFTGEYPLAHIEFQDSTLPVKVELEAFSPFIPHQPDDSGLPVAILRYRVSNPGGAEAKVGIAFSIDNPVIARELKNGDVAAPQAGDGRRNEFRTSDGVFGLLMTNGELRPEDPMAGDFAIAAMPSPNAEITHWEGWPLGRWWNSPLLFWDQFSKSGRLGNTPDPHDKVGVLCVQKTIQPGHSEGFEFFLGWHFLNRTPEWCGWSAPPGDEKTIIGNYYAERFKSAWDAVLYTAQHLKDLEAGTRTFVDAMRASTIPAAVKEAASANLSTLATTTCFRTADGEFHGFEGSDDTRGCCHGNCTHVWNYETVTPFLFPSFARSLRRSSFGFSMDDAGAMHFRQMLPDGKTRWGFAAADGQMGQIIHAWIDWKISGDEALLRSTWPRVKKAIEFAWIPGGWDANRDGVMEGVQHNTYDVEFYGPNPMCGIYYLGGLRAAEEMARAAGDRSSSDLYRRLFEQGSRWVDANLFNGEFYIQTVRGFRKDEIAKDLRSSMGSEDTENPEYQAGAGCLVDQLVGQYLADAGGLGPLVSPENIRTTLHSIYRYNYKRSLARHDNVERTYALNDEAAVVVCDYGKTERPHIPFPYFAEAWTGLEYTAAALMMRWGMTEQGVEIVTSARARFDGEKRNPWDEAECGHHYARAMSSWSTMLAMSGFRYDGSNQAVSTLPPARGDDFTSIWATGTGWGRYSLHRQGGRTRLALQVLGGELLCHSCELQATGESATVSSGGRSIQNQTSREKDRAIVRLADAARMGEGEELRIEVHA
ncbi:MAG TPA: GH116 family glycosyl-hydrolase [Terracidiphilus sp.]